MPFSTSLLLLVLFWFVFAYALRVFCMRGARALHRFACAGVASYDLLCFACALLFPMPASSFRHCQFFAFGVSSSVSYLLCLYNSAPKVVQYARPYVWFFLKTEDRRLV